MPFPVPGRIAEQLRQSTVQIRSGRGRMQGSGSGFVLNAGHIVTNAHVVAASQTNGDLSIESWDGQTRQAKVSKIDRRRDLALVSMEGGNTVPGILASQPAQPGQPVIAVGNPLGFVGAIS